MNSHALALAEAGLYADALIEIEQAEILAPSDATVHWNAAWIRHHLDVSRQLALASPFPVLSHVFAGDWDSSFDALWTMGVTNLFGDTPIPTGSAAFGFEHTVGELLVQYGNNALTLQPERAVVHALGRMGPLSGQPRRSGRPFRTAEGGRTGSGGFPLLRTRRRFRRVGEERELRSGKAGL